MTLRLVLPVVSVLLAVAAAASAVEQPRPRQLTVWLMFAEPAASDGPMSVNEIRIEADDFNGQLQKDCPHVTVLNTTLPQLRTQLAVWNLEFAGPLWRMIKGQQRTLDSLCRFAAEHKERPHLNVRFVTWGEAFGELQDTIKQHEDAPDVAQVGSTWVAYFAEEQKMLLPQHGYPDVSLQWRNLPGYERVALRYLIDVRLLFYWKRLPKNPAPFTLNATSWEDILTSLEAAPQPSPPMVLPIGPTFNLLHDYISLVWAGRSDFWMTGWFPQVDLDSEQAIQIPLQLARSAPYLLAFSEMTHEEATQHFLSGAYRAIIEPSGFISRWYTHFGNIKSFWDCAGVAALPETFKGGSDLVVWSHTEAPELASDLARFLVTDAGYTSMLAESGHLPAQPDQLAQSLGLLQAALGGQSSQGAQGLINVIQKTVEEGREYPAYAEWPTEIESREVLEAVQNVWRLTGERNEDGVKASAAEAEVVINKRIHWPTWLWETAKVWWQYILIFLSFILAVLIFVLVREVKTQKKKAKAEADRSQALEDKLLTLSLYRAKAHALRYSDRIREFSRFSDQEELKKKLEDYGSLIRDYRNHLNKITEATLIEIEDRSGLLNMQEIVEESWNLAKMQFEVDWAICSPEINLDYDNKDLFKWKIMYLPNVLVIILQEWFYNCLKEISPIKEKEGYLSNTIYVSIDECKRQSILRIVSPAPIPQKDILILAQPPSVDYKILGGAGLTLIRDLLWRGFKTEASCCTGQTEGTSLTIQLPLKRVL